MAYVAAAWAFIKGLFAKKTVGVIFRIIFGATASATAQALCDPAVQEKALEIAKMLQEQDLDATEKARLFNKMMKQWFDRAGRMIGASLLNAIRELAVAALKTSREAGV